MKRMLVLFCVALSLSCTGQLKQPELPFLFPDNRIQELLARNRQPLILDFFSSSCAVCFKLLPKLKQLQEKYKGRLNFALLGVEDNRIRNIYAQFEKKWQLSFPVIYDSILPKSLGIKEYPAYGWIDRDGQLRALTGAEELTEQNINRFLEGQALTGLVKEVKQSTFDPDKPFLIDGNGGPDTSVVSRHTVGKWEMGQPLYIPPAIFSLPPTQFQALGVTIDELYNYAYFGYGKWDMQSALWDSLSMKVVFDPIDSTLIQMYRGNRYSVSIENRDVNFSYGRLQQVLRKELETLFSYDAWVTSKKIKCYYLQADGEAKSKLKTTGGKKREIVQHSGIRMENATIKDLLMRLYYYHQEGPPFIDRTGIDFHIDISFDAILMDIADVQRGLKPFGLRLVPGEKEMTVIYLRRKKENVATR